MKNKILIIISTLLLLSNCGSTDSHLANEIIGEWRMIELTAQDLSKPDSKLETSQLDNEMITYEFKADKETFVLNSSGKSTEGTFQIHNGIIDFTGDFELGKLKIYEIDKSNLKLGRKIEEVESIKIKFKKIIIE